MTRHRWAACFALWASACGARSELEDLALPTDGAPSCERLVLRVAPTVVMSDGPIAHTAPRLVSRSDAFDLVAFKHEPSSIVASRLRVSGNRFDAGAPVALFGGARSYASAAGNDRDLAVCTAGEVGAPTRFASFDDAFGLRVGAGLGFAGGDSCLDLAWRNDHWRVAWYLVRGTAQPFLADVAPDGTLLSEPTAARDDGGSSGVAIAAYTRGIAWTSARPGAPGPIEVTLEPDGEPIRRASIDSSADEGVDRAVVVGSPYDAEAVIVAFAEGDDSLRVVTVLEDGHTFDRSEPESGSGGAMSLAQFRGRPVLARRRCRAGDCTIAVSWLDRDGAPLDTLDIEADGSPRMATDGRLIALAWGRSRADGGSEIMAAAIGCEP